MVEDNVICRFAEIPFPELVNIYGCMIGPKTVIGPFVEIQKGAIIGAGCKIQSHTFICDLVAIEDDVFIGHGVMFCNDKYPPGGKLESIFVRKGAVIGSGATILPGVIIGKYAIVGAGAVVTKSVPNGTTVVGNPARDISKIWQT